jgi:hypothetical protein
MSNSDNTVTTLTQKIFTEHIPPPIGIVGGSLVVQADLALDHTPIAGGTHRYTHPNSAFSIVGVVILTRGFGIRYKNVVLSDPTIEIWLQTPPTGPANIVIASPGFTMDVDKDLGNPVTIPDPHRPIRYSHPGFQVGGSVPDFQIERVRVSDLINNDLSTVYDATRPTKPGEEDPGFQIMIFKEV